MVTVSAAASAIAAARTVIIKIGSSLLIDDDRNAVDADWLGSVANDIAMLRADGKNVVVVSSGAIALGSRGLGITGRALAIEEKQAAAATGQVTLAHAWREALAFHDIRVAQILLSPEDTETRRRHLNARATMSSLLGRGAVPVVNENDTVATTEIRFGDNDRLAARVAAMISADLLILLSDIDGLYSGNPRQDNAARHVPEVAAINDEVMAMAGTANASYASGGMVTKLEAARIAMNAGCGMIICDGRGARPVGGALTPKGRITVDNGAVRALRQGRSLLPAGVVAANGAFERGDLIAIEDESRQVIGHGLSAYSVGDTRAILGHKSSEIEDLLGYRGRDEVIHADNLAMLEPGS
jgi:glutamate 5-kinase